MTTCPLKDGGAVSTRPTAADRGYDSKWRRNRARFLAAHPTCIDCGEPATVADHAPRSRRELLAAGEPHPDAWKHLQPRCEPCHNKRTAREQPGGWAARPPRRRPREQHPGRVGGTPSG